MTTKPTRGPIGRFQVREQLGRGGMGVVWLCYDPQLGRDVAVKMLVEQAAEGSDRLARFLQEARLMARLDHPGIVALRNEGVAIPDDPGAGPPTNQYVPPPKDDE